MKTMTEIFEIKELTDAQIAMMYNLMGRYYDNLSEDQFGRDLQKKTKVIVLLDGDTIYGFSTIQHMPLTVEGQEILGIFSGNTIVDPVRPLGLGLQKTFTSYIHELMQTEKRPLYWFLICKGYMTYKYMSMYFDYYWPMPGHKTPPFEKQVMDAYASAKYGDLYKPKTGIIYNQGDSDYLKEGVAPIDDRARQNPVVAFFEEKNPGHEKGDELVCLARFSEDNLKPTFYRMIGR